MYIASLVPACFLHPGCFYVLNTSLSIFCESIAFFVVKACERAPPNASLSASKLPRVLHHELEVVVTVDRAAHALVVLAELCERDDAVGLLRVPLGHELLEDLVGRLPALLDVGVLARVIDLSDVFQGHLTVLIHIEFVIGGLDPHLAALVQLSLEGL